MVHLGDEAQVVARFSPFGDGVILTHAMELQGDVGHVEFRFGPFGDSVNVGGRYVHGLCQTCHRIRNRFGHTRWFSYVMRLKWKLISVHLEIVLILMQDRWMVCAECTIGS